jgi:hypothetical protein
LCHANAHRSQNAQRRDFNSVPKSHEDNPNQGIDSARASLICNKINLESKKKRGWCFFFIQESLQARLGI